MLQKEEFFGDAELRLVYMARRLSDALEVENLFTQAGVDYLVDTGKYTAGFLIKRELTGAFFYVLPEDVALSHDLLRANRREPFAGETV